MLVYLIIYIPFILCAYFDFIKTSKEDKGTILWVWVIVFTLFRGLRWEIGTDWYQFYEVYQEAEWDNIFNYARDNWSNKVMDYGYMFINTLFHKSGFSYTVFLLVTNFWIMWCYKDFAERHTKYPIITMIMLMNVGVPFPVRQTIAFATSFWGYRFAVEKKWSYYILIAIAAALIHKASLISLIIVFVPYVVERWRIKWWWYVLVYLSTFGFAKMFSDYISSAILLVGETNEQLGAYGKGYLLNDSFSVDYGKYSVSALNGLSYSLFFIVLLWVREKYRLTCNLTIKHFETFFFMYAVAEVINNLSRSVGESGLVEILGRIMSTIDMAPLIYPLIFTIFITKTIKDRNISLCVFVVYMLYKFWQQIPASFYYKAFIPYHSIFDL